LREFAQHRLFAMHQWYPELHFVIGACNRDCQTSKFCPHEVVGRAEDGRDLYQHCVAAAFEKTYGKFGKLDLVVNNAGISTFDGNWQRTIDVNLVNSLFTVAD
jgi:NAD(P)-dependent dehydrogenase (short-subunit alcohol dehydrogenase family)